MTAEAQLVVACAITPSPGNIPYANVPRRLRDRVFGDVAQSAHVIIVAEDSRRHHAEREKLELIQTPIRYLLTELKESEGLGRIRDLMPNDKPDKSTLLLCLGKSDFCQKFVGFFVNGCRSAQNGWVAKLGNVVTGAKVGEVIWLDAMHPGEITSSLVWDLCA